MTPLRTRLLGTISLWMYRTEARGNHATGLYEGTLYEYRGSL